MELEDEWRLECNDAGQVRLAAAQAVAPFLTPRKGLHVASRGFANSIAASVH